MNRHLLWCLLILLCSNSFAFDPPSCGDPWYYQSDDRYEFWVPDKVQHYWGSYLLNKITVRYLGDVGGSITSFAFGFLWEVKDSKTSLGTVNGGVVGFSVRDLLADGLGVLSERINTHQNIKFYTVYDTQERYLMLNVTVTF